MKQRKTQKRLSKLSMQPLTPEQALAGAMQVAPPAELKPKPKTKAAKKKRKKGKKRKN